MSWSRNCRLFYGEREHGAYLPVRNVAHAIIKEIGFEGWVSMELFNRVMERKDEGVVEELASRAGESWRRMVVDLGMEEEAEEVRRRIVRTDSGTAIPEREVEVARL
jgi:4-hydroxyphenylpyruvate dioxygenase